MLACCKRLGSLARQVFVGDCWLFFLASNKNITEVGTASQLEVLRLIALERLDLAQILDPWTLGTLSVQTKSELWKKILVVIFAFEEMLEVEFGTRPVQTIPGPSKGWCLNPKGLLSGTPYHQFGTPRRVQVCIHYVSPCSQMFYVWFFVLKGWWVAWI